MEQTLETLVNNRKIIISFQTNKEMINENVIKQYKFAGVEEPK